MAMTKSKTKKKSNVIWSLFSSVKLTIALLIFLAIASIIGTLIPQIPQRESYEFARSLSPGVFRFFNSLHLFDMYHSPWFRFLIGCLALNLIICSTDRLPVTWKLFRKMPRPDRRKPFENLPPQQTFLIKGGTEKTSDRVSQFLKSRFRKIHTKKAVGKYFFCGEKGRYSRFGVYLVHLSILLILIGALTGSFFGFEAYVNIMEGEQIDTVTLRGGMDQSLELGFEVRCDKFTVDFYENGAPKEYRSELTFLVNGEKVEKKSLLVNHPTQFMGITFYQSTYGSIPGRKVHLRISRHTTEHETTTHEVEPGNPMQLPGNEGKLTVTDVKGDFMDTGPAVLISIQPQNGEEQHFWVFQNHELIRKRLPPPMLKSPKFDPSAFKPYTFFLDGLETSYYTGLQVNKDPGVPVVWAGCFLIVAGFFVTFFTSHRRIWVRLSSEKQGINISIAGTSSKNPVGLERELIHLTQDLKNLFNEIG
jgi:cytochrome c biogenesis protein